MTRLKIIGNALTELLGALLCITINSNETTSGAAYRLKDDGYGWLYKAINALFFWQDDHCKLATTKELVKCRALINAYGGEVVHTIKSDVVVAKALYEPPKAPTKPVDPVVEAVAVKDEFDAQAYFDSLPADEKRDVVEHGVRDKMTREQRYAVKRIADLWWQSDAMRRDGHGL